MKPNDTTLNSTTEVFPAFAALHVYSDDNGNVVLSQNGNTLIFPSQMAADVAHFVLEAGRGDR